jgi:hypothetical protein
MYVKFLVTFIAVLFFLNRLLLPNYGSPLPLALTDPSNKEDGFVGTGAK